MAEQSNNDDYIKEDSNKEIENEQQENNLEIEQLNETLNPVSASSEEKDFLESKKAILESQNEPVSPQKEGQNEKEGKEQTDTQQETTATLFSLFALPKLIEKPLLKARMNYDWDSQDESLMNEGISAMSKKYGADGKMLPPEVIYGIGIGLPPAKAYIINKIKEILDRQKKAKEQKNPEAQPATQVVNPQDYQAQMEMAKRGGLNG